MTAQQLENEPLNMEVGKEPVIKEELSGGLDSDDETLRFEQEDDLYAADLDEADAKWVLKQVKIIKCYCCSWLPCAYGFIHAELVSFPPPLPFFRTGSCP